MKRLIISVFAAVVLLTAATTALWSHSTSPDRYAASTQMMSVQALYSAAGVNKLPNEDFEDQSLVFSTVTKR